MKRVLQTRLKSEPYRSGLEKRIAKDLEERSVPYLYEPYKLSYVIPSRVASYTPDLVLPNNIVIEIKGYLDAKSRHKMILVKSDFPDLDVRFLFQKLSNPIYKGSPTTYAKWCEEHGFPFAEGNVPQAWLEEPWKPLHPCLKPKTPKKAKAN